MFQLPKKARMEDVAGAEVCPEVQAAKEEYGRWKAKMKVRLICLSEYEKWDEREER